jgi:hypothetical protein
VPAVSGHVEIVLHDIQRLLAARHERFVGRGRVEADRPQNLRHQILRLERDSEPLRDAGGP